MAEAAALDDDEETAVEALETLLKNRFVTGTEIEITERGDALVERIRLERRLELCFEGHRWFDLRRYGMPSITRVWKNGDYVKSYTLKREGPVLHVANPAERVGREPTVGAKPITRSKELKNRML